MPLSTITEHEVQCSSLWFYWTLIGLLYFSLSNQNLMVCFLVTVILRLFAAHGIQPTSSPTSSPLPPPISSCSWLALPHTLLFYHKLFLPPAMTTVYAPSKQFHIFNTKTLSSEESSLALPSSESLFEPALQNSLTETISESGIMAHTLACKRQNRQTPVRSRPPKKPHIYFALCLWRPILSYCSTRRATWPRAYYVINNQ